MSLYASYSPVTSLSGSYSSSWHNRAAGSPAPFTLADDGDYDEEAMKTAEDRKQLLENSFKKCVDETAFQKKIDEKTPLIQTNKDLPPTYEKKKEEPAASINATLLITILCVTLGSSFQFGYATGVMNNAEQFIVGYYVNQGKEYTLTDWSITVSSYGIGGLLGSVIGPKVIGRFCGRRSTLLWNNVFLFISSFLTAFAPQWWYQAIGRVFVGIVAGVATAVVPTYFSEISPIAVRGAVGTMHQLGITIGILISQALSTPSLHLLGSEEKWQWLFFVPAAAGAIECCILPFCPESPSYLYATQGEEAARGALSRLLPEDQVDEYLGNIREEVSAKLEGDSEGSMSVYELFRCQPLRKQLIVGIAVQLMMQFSGIDAVLYYSTSVFYDADVSDPELATTFLGVVNVFVTIIAVKCMDSAGRKTLLSYSWIGLFFSFLVLTLSFVFKPLAHQMDLVSVVSMAGIIIFFAFGPGCIAWFIIAEIFPMYARDTAMTVGIFINWMANWLVAFTFPNLLMYTQPYTFLVFVGTAAFFLFFTVRFVPETKGLTVQQITEKFKEVPL